jgi:addiction module RelB/DinJ family antitoxin
MSLATINVRLEKDLKHEVEEVCREMGINMTTAFTLFAKRLVMDRKIPFEVSANPSSVSRYILSPDFMTQQVYETDLGDDAPASIPRFTTLEALAELIEEGEASGYGTDSDEFHAKLKAKYALQS